MKRKNYWALAWIGFQCQELWKTIQLCEVIEFLWMLDQFMSQPITSQSEQKFISWRDSHRLRELAAETGKLIKSWFESLALYSWTDSRKTLCSALFTVFSLREHILLLRKICWHSWWQTHDFPHSDSLSVWPHLACGWARDITFPTTVDTIQKVWLFDKILFLIFKVVRAH